jgi:exodeoxyribonuclease VII large subunit
VADLRAPTPSAAAELIVPTRRELLEAIGSRGERLERAARFRLTDAARRLHERGAERAASVVERGLRRRAQGLDEIVERLRNLDPRFRLAAARRRLEAAAGALAEDARRRVAGARARLDALERMHAALSPLAILERGYAIVEDAQGQIIKDAAAAPPKTLIDVRLARGSLRARVTRSTPAGSSALPS